MSGDLEQMRAEWRRDAIKFGIVVIIIGALVIAAGVGVTFLLRGNH